MTVPPDVIDRYLKVQALHKGATTAGERAAAAKVLQRIEQEYPTIQAEAMLHEAHARPWSAPPSTQPSLSWKELFDLAASASGNFVDWLKAGSEQTAAIHEAREILDEEVLIEAKVTKQGKVSFVVTLDPDVMDDLIALAEDDLVATEIKTRLGTLVGDAFEDLLRAVVADD